MRFTKLWQKLLGVERTVVEQVSFDEDEGAVVASVRPAKGATRRCGVCHLAHWLAWTARCQVPAFVALGAKVRRHRVAIEASLRSGTSNALVESTNTKIRVLTRVAFGFASPEALIAMAMLAVGGVCPDLPGRGSTVAFELAAA